MIELAKYTLFFVVVFVIGAFFLYIGVYENIPGPETNWSIQKREKAGFEVLLLGSGLMLLAIVLFVLSFFNRTNVNGNSSIDEDLGDVDLGAEDLDEASAKSHPIVVRLLNESDTLLSVVKFLYEDIYVTKMSLDEFFDKYKDVHRSSIKNEDEMYYRLRTLEYLGLLELDKVATRANQVCKIPQVTTLLHKAKVIQKSGPEKPRSGQKRSK